jgi:hypothetical protein
MAALKNTARHRWKKAHAIVGGKKREKNRERMEREIERDCNALNIF